MIVEPDGANAPHLSVLPDRLKYLTGVLLAIGIAMRLAGLDMLSGDMRIFLVPWYDAIVANDWMSALRGEYSNYSPPYLYLLTIAAKANVLLPKVIAIKLISILFDSVNAYLVFRIVRHRAKHDSLPLLAAGLFFCLPTVAVNSAAWGQADAVYTCFVLSSVHLLLRHRPARAMLVFGIAAAFKAQSLFLAPFLLLLALKRRIPLWTCVLVPAAYLLAMVPALIAGRSLSGVLTVYVDQARTYRSLSMNAANLYALMPDSWYEPGVVIGLALAAAIALAWVLACVRGVRDLSADIIILCATVSAGMMPFLLPKMHDRFFYLLEVFSLLLAFFMPRVWVAAVAAQASSALVYLIHVLPSTSSVPLRDVVMGIAVLLNSSAIGFLVWRQWRTFSSPCGRKPDPSRAPADRG
jgi:Gpi18-like mannosyltransferase